MSSTKTIFVAFAMEDVRQRDLLKGQTLGPRAPYEFIDMSVKERYESGWKGKVRTRIRRSDGVIALISRSSISSEGQAWEIQCARDENKPVLGVWAYLNDHTTLSGLRTVSWTDVNISHFIDNI